MSVHLESEIEPGLHKSPGPTSNKNSKGPTTSIEDNYLDIEESEDDTSETYSNAVPRPNDNAIYNCRDSIFSTLGKYADVLKKIIYGLLLVTYTVYFAFAIKYSVDLATGLIGITSIVLICMFYIYIRDNFGDAIDEKCLSPVSNFLERIWPVLKW